MEKAANGDRSKVRQRARGIEFRRTKFRHRRLLICKHRRRIRSEPALFSLRSHRQPNQRALLGSFRFSRAWPRRVRWREAAILSSLRSPRRHGLASSRTVRVSRVTSETHVLLFFHVVKTFREQTGGAWRRQTRLHRARRIAEAGII